MHPLPLLSKSSEDGASTTCRPSRSRPIIADTNTNKLQIVQNSALRTITGCTQDTNINHLHTETSTLPIKDHLQLHASQLRQQSLNVNHTLHHLTTQPNPPRMMKQTIYHNLNFTTNIDTSPHLATPTAIKQNLKTIHSQIVQNNIARNHNSLLNAPPPPINNTELTLPHNTRRTLAQLRANKSPFLRTYLHKIDPTTYTTPQCPLCPHHTHDTKHLFTCPAVPTTLVPEDLWRDPPAAAQLLQRWEDLGGGRPVTA